MKIKITYILAFLLLSGYIHAQLDRTKVPSPGPAPKIQLGEYESFTLDNGLKVFVVENHKLPKVTYSLVLDLDAIKEGGKAGYVSIAGQLLRNGTSNRPKSVIDEEVDFIGATLNTSSGGVSGSSLKKHTNKLLELMADVLLNPSFPVEELEKIKKQTISNLQANKEDPNAIASDVRAVLNFREHPYGELTTEETVQNIDRASVIGFYQTYFKPNIAYMAIVGDINRKEAQKLIKKYFGNWERGEVPKNIFKVPEAPSKTLVAMVDRPQSVQSIINVSYPVNLKPGSEDAIKARVMNTILGGGFSSNLMQNLREDHGFTYGARSSLSGDKLIGNFNASASVRNEVTDSSVVEFLYELNRIRTENVSEEQLKSIKNYITGGFARSLENPQTIANFAINIERYNLPKDYYANYLMNIEAVSVADVKEMAQKYIKPDNAYILVVGKASEVIGNLGKFGDVKYYDIYGNEYEPSAAKAIPEGLTSANVIERYIEARGGIEKLKNVTDYKMVMTASFQGQTVEIIDIKKAPNKSFSKIALGGAIELNKVIANGDEMAQYAQGQKAPVSENDKIDTQIRSALFSELIYDQYGVKTKLTAIENINGKDAYAIEVEYPTGTKSTDYFDVESGLKIRTTTTVSTPQGESIQTIEFHDYKAVDGIFFPHKILIPVGGGLKLTAEAQSIEVNKGVDDAVFKIE